jgi:hypothetical protein
MEFTLFDHPVSVVNGLLAVTLLTISPSLLGLMQAFGKTKSWLLRRRKSLLQHTAKKRHDNYSRNKKDPNFFAPALTQRFVSVKT